MVWGGHSNQSFGSTIYLFTAVYSVVGLNQQSSGTLILQILPQHYDPQNFQNLNPV